MKEEASHSTAQGRGRRAGVSRALIIVAFIFIFLAAFGVRLLSWQDTRGEVEKVQTVVVGDYKRVARLLREGGAASFFDSSSPLADPNNLGHPPGYSILLAVIYRLTGERDAPVQMLQITLDALCAVLIFLIVAERLHAGAGFIAGLLAALSPQFAWNSVLLLPDTLSIFPILLAVYLLTLTRKRPRVLTFVLAGACVGISCWLRANALLLAPFLALACLLLLEKGRRARYAAALLCGAVLVIAPLTIRNAIVLRHFIPLSLGAGQTFLEGIADYDREGRFNVPATDMGIMKWEAENFNRPDYYGTLFNPDGVWRERMRLRRGLSIAASHPFWFAGVMTRRAASMLRLERARQISAEPPVSHALDEAGEAQLVRLNSPAELKAASALSPQARVTLMQDNQAIELTGDDSRYGDQFVSAPFEIQKDTDYVLTLSVKILRGRMSISVRDAGTTHASAIVETEEMKTPEEQPEKLIRLAFVSARTGQAQLVISNAAPQQANPLIRIGTLKLFNLGQASNTWTRIPRTLVNALQKLYITAIMLPLSILGLILLVRSRAYQTLVILLIVPAYYLLIQSATHTEYRYVLIIHYFLFALTAIFIYTAGNYLSRRLRKS
jgi:hypothetical protein